MELYNYKALKELFRKHKEKFLQGKFYNYTDPMDEFREK